MRLYELRSNPDKNPKTSILDELKKYKDRSDVFVSFTELKKLGVNPQSGYHTPIGIYAYPVKQLWSMYIHPELGNITTDRNMERLVPFAGDKPFAMLFQIQDPTGIVVGTKKFSKADLEEKLTRINNYVTSLVGDYLSKGDPNFWPATFADILKDSKVKARNTSPFGQLWFVTKEVSRVLDTLMRNRREDRREPARSNRDNRAAILWNKLMREIGIVGFVDSVKQGIIHENEPMQAVFFSKENLRVIDVLQNKLRNPNVSKVDRMAKSMVAMVTGDLERKLVKEMFPSMKGYFLKPTPPSIDKVLHPLDHLWYTLWKANSDKINPGIEQPYYWTHFNKASSRATSFLFTNDRYKETVRRAIESYHREVQSDANLKFVSALNNYLTELLTVEGARTVALLLKGNNIKVPSRGMLSGVIETELIPVLIDQAWERSQYEDPKPTEKPDPKSFSFVIAGMWEQDLAAIWAEYRKRIGVT